MSLESQPNTYWTEEKISDLLNYLEQITSKLDEQSKYYQRQNEQFDYQQTDEYKAEQTKILNDAKALEEQEQLDQEQYEKMMTERHEEIITALNGVTEAAGDQTTNTTLIDSFNEFKESYISHRDDFDLFIWVAFVTFLFITAFKTLNGQIWRA